MMRSDAMARLRKVCGLLASDQPGERSAAALKATAMLKAAGMTWEDVDLGAAPLARVYADAAMVDLYQRLLDSERARTSQMSEEIGRLKREVQRLKGMWPKGQPKVAA